MEPNDDPQLRKLLREWEVSGAPPSLDERVLGRRRPWWQFLFTGYIRVPVPLGVAMTVALVVLAVYFVRDRARTPIAPPGKTVSLTEFRPVDNVNVRIIRSGYESH
ncbi:hypothetical protein SBA4_800006 [Candidatus Sulfopaludibacter sp. SbA4]|nr:hypothetical protein SBA4_800006 [Candidatus Sulfopaludibacter sp. SbA4]